MRGWSVLAAVSMLVVACTTASEENVGPDVPPQQIGPTEVASEPAATVDGGTAVVAARDEPETLHPWMAEPDSDVGMITRPVLAPLWRVRPDGTSEPWLLADQPTVREATGTAPFTVTYRIRADAFWSDGEPIDGRDVLFTLETCIRDAPRDDCEYVDLSRSSADGRQATVAFERPVAAWRTVLQSLPVLPEHVLRGRPAQTVWTRQIDVASGPFAFASWAPGERIVLERNDRWWGAPPALDRIEFRFDARGTVGEVIDGVIDVAQLPASPSAVEQARADARVRGVVAPGSGWVAIDFNLAAPLIERRAIRRALALAIDRATIVNELIHMVSPTTTVINELPGGPMAPDGQSLPYPRFDPARAASELDAAGCPAGEDGIRVCADRPLEVDLMTTTAGDWQQTVIADYVRSQLAAVGVRVSIAGPPSETPAAPSESPSAPSDGARAWDLRVTTVTAGAGRTGGSRWRCDDPANTQGFCAAPYDELIEQASMETDPEQRAAFDAEAALLLADDLPTYPMYETPVMLVHSRGVRGPALSRLPWGLMWNVDEWARTAD